MIVAQFNYLSRSHDCWGKYETFEELRVREFGTIESWLAYRTQNDRNIKVIAVYEVSKKIV